MKNLFNYFMAVLFISTFVFTSCKEDTESENPQVNPAETLMDHLVDIDMDLNHVIKNADGQKFVMAAPADGNLSGKYVIDIRSAESFNAGHIAGAHNVEFTNILTEAATADKPILVVCYTGQTACYATSLLRLYGYHDAQALKWGMSGWNALTDSWSAKIGDIAKDHNNWSYSEAPDRMVYDLPTFTSTSTAGSDILRERVEYVVSQGFKTVDAQNIIDNPTSHFVNNYFSGTDYAAFGHVKDAQRLLPLLIEPLESGDATMTNMDPGKKIATYCYTGQTSAVITAYLRVLGYDAYSVTFGMNKFYNTHTAWTTNQWGGDSNPKDLDLAQ